MESRHFFETLFELSNEYRYQLLTCLHETPMSLTNLAKKTGISMPETNRHLTRLSQVNLIYKNTEGLFQLSEYAKMIKIIIEDLEFLSENMDFFFSHEIVSIPPHFIKRIGELKHTIRLDDVMQFLAHCEKTIKNANNFVWLLVGQFPLIYLDMMAEGLKNGVKYRIIESTERGFNTQLEILFNEDAKIKELYQSQLDWKMFDHGGLFMCVTEQTGIFSLPRIWGESDYRGFLTQDFDGLEWCRTLYNYYWQDAQSTTISKFKEFKEKHIELERKDSILVEGMNNPIEDVQNVQRAVDQFNEVNLMGKFNFGHYYISICKDTILRGIGRDNNIPETKIRKQGWDFPFSTYDKLIDVRGKDIRVTIENIHFMDFNNTCILAMEGHDITVMNNWFTLYTPVGRGMKYHKWGNQISAMVLSGNIETGGFDGNTIVKGNHIDFGLEFLQSNRIALNGIEEDPFYRPDLEKPENFVSYGIIINRKLGNVIIEDNVIKNVNFAAIFCMDNYDTADVSIISNKIDLDVFGSYFINSVYAGYGVSIKSYWQHPEPLGGFKVSIKDNEIRCRKVNFCGISVTGPARGYYQMKGLKKLYKGEIENNKIQLDDGAVGIHLDMCDEFNISDNIISGMAYYGMQISGSKLLNSELEANNNVIKNTLFEDLQVKDPDKYADSINDEKVFFKAQNQSNTAHIWLNNHTNRNLIQKSINDTIIDEGKDNKVTF